MKCLIIAAGKGSRLQLSSSPKPLIKVLGIPLIERVIRTAIKAGADEFYVVVGKKADVLSSFLGDLSLKLDIPIKVIYNEKWDTSENGYSVLKAYPYLEKEDFLLLMGDHIVDESILKRVISEKKGDEDIVLGVDVRVKDNDFIDIEDVTKVKFNDDGIIEDIGKGLKDYNGFDTGVFFCSPKIFGALKEIKDEKEMTLSRAVKILSLDGRAKVCKINEGFWFDVDTPSALKKAEDFLIESLKSKDTDGPISRYINRRFSLKITKKLVNYNITPNQISVFSFFLCLISAYLFSLNGYFPLLLGGLLAQFASIVDGCDGEIARIKYMSSDFGKWLDAVLDRYADGFLLWGLMWHSFGKDSVFWGVLAIIGSFIVSYTADKYDSLMKEKISKSSFFRIGRDVRIFVVFVGTLLNIPVLTLAFIAVFMNVEAVRRIFVCRG